MFLDYDAAILRAASEIKAFKDGYRTLPLEAVITVQDVDTKAQT